MYAWIHRKINKIITLMDKSKDQQEIESEITSAIRKSFIMRLDEEELEKELNDLIQADSYEVFLLFHCSVLYMILILRICFNCRHPLSHNLENYRQFHRIRTQETYILNK